MHIEQLKLRTRCRACGEVGHWAKECKRNTSSGGSSSSTPGSSSNTSFYWTGTGSNSGHQTFLSFAEHVRAAEKKSQQRVQELPFVGVSTSSNMGLVDTAAQEGLIGRPALLRLADTLRKQGLRIHWTGRESQASGIGGKATTVGVCEIPIGLGKVSGVLEVTVVAEDVPLLLPISLLRSLGAIIDLPNNVMELKYVNGKCTLVTLPSGRCSGLGRAVDFSASMCGQESRDRFSAGQHVFSEQQFGL